MGCWNSTNQAGKNPQRNCEEPVNNGTKASNSNCSPEPMAEEKGVMSSGDVIPPQPEFDLTIEEPEQPVEAAEVVQPSPSDQMITKWGVLLEESEQPIHPLNLLPDDWANEEALDPDEVRRMDELNKMDYGERKAEEVKQSKEVYLRREE